MPPRSLALIALPCYIYNGVLEKGGGGGTSLSMTKGNIICVKKQYKDTKSLTLTDLQAASQNVISYVWCHPTKHWNNFFLQAICSAVRCHVIILHGQISCQTFCILMFQRDTFPSLRSQMILLLRWDLNKTFHLIGFLKNPMSKHWKIHAYKVTISQWRATKNPHIYTIYGNILCSLINLSTKCITCSNMTSLKKW